MDSLEWTWRGTKSPLGTIVWYKKIWSFYWKFLGNVDGVEADRKVISVIHPLASTAVPPPSLFLEAWEIPVSGIKKYKKYMERNSTWGGHLVAACLLNCFLLLPITFSSNRFLNTPGWQRLAFHITRLLLCSFSKLFFHFVFSFPRQKFPLLEGPTLTTSQILTLVSYSVSS